MFLFRFSIINVCRSWWSIVNLENYWNQDSLNKCSGTWFLFFMLNFFFCPGSSTWSGMSRMGRKIQFATISILQEIMVILSTKYWGNQGNWLQKFIRDEPIVSRCFTSPLLTLELLSISSTNLEIREILENFKFLNFIGTHKLFIATIFKKKPVVSYFEFLMSFIKKILVTFCIKNKRKDWKVRPSNVYISILILKNESNLNPNWVRLTAEAVMTKESYTAWRRGIALR